VIRTPYVLAGALAAGLASATAWRFSLVPAALALGLAALRPRASLAVALALAGWWWGSERLQALDRSVLAPRIGTAGGAIVDVTEPPRRGRYEVRVRAVAVRWSGARIHEPLLVLLPGRRAPPQGARLRVLGTLRCARPRGGSCACTAGPPTACTPGSHGRRLLASPASGGR